MPDASRGGDRERLASAVLEDLLRKSSRIGLRCGGVVCEVPVVGSGVTSGSIWWVAGGVSLIGVDIEIRILEEELVDEIVSRVEVAALTVGLVRSRGSKSPGRPSPLSRGPW